VILSDILLVLSSQGVYCGITSHVSTNLPNAFQISLIIDVRKTRKMVDDFPLEVWDKFWRRADYAPNALGKPEMPA